MLRTRKTRFWVGLYGESSMPCPKILPFATVLLCAAVPLSFADQVVYFVNGKAIMVKSIEKGDKFTILEMEGGGKVGVPTDQISKIEDFVVTAPSAAPAVPVQSMPVPAAMAPIAAAAPNPVTAPPAIAPGPPAAPAMAPGPGVGGKPAGGPNDNLARVKPLDVGGNNNGGPMQRPYPQAGSGPGTGGPGGSMLGMAARPNFGAGRRFGRGLNPAGRGGRPGMVDAGRAAPTAQTAPTPPPQPQATQPPAAPPPGAAVEPEAPPTPPDDSNEEPSDPPAPQEGDSSGNSPGSAS